MAGISVVVRQSIYAFEPIENSDTTPGNGDDRLAGCRFHGLDKIVSQLIGISAPHATSAKCLHTVDMAHGLDNCKLSAMNPAFRMRGKTWINIGSRTELCYGELGLSQKFSDLSLQCLVLFLKNKSGISFLLEHTIQVVVLLLPKCRRIQLSNRLAITMTSFNAVAEILDVFWHNVRSDLLLETLGGDLTKGVVAVVATSSPEAIPEGIREGNQEEIKESCCRRETSRGSSVRPLPPLSHASRWTYLNAATFTKAKCQTIIQFIVQIDPTVLGLYGPRFASGQQFSRHMKRPCMLFIILSV
ncbi:hypothetical protein KCU90_g67, partial [Aureobasidium melanogenum]